jgi:hypothetical protein
MKLIKFFFSLALGLNLSSYGLSTDFLLQDAILQKVSSLWGQDEPLTSPLVNPQDLLPKELNLEAAGYCSQERTHFVLTLLKGQINPYLPLKRDELHKTLCFASFLLQEHAPSQDSVFVHSDQIYTFMPLQIYPDQSLFLHLYQLDPLSTKGGYKAFSRSIKLNDYKIYANINLLKK